MHFLYFVTYFCHNTCCEIRAALRGEGAAATHKMFFVDRRSIKSEQKQKDRTCMKSGVLLLQSGNNLCGGVTPECSTAERICNIYSLSYSLTWSYLVPIYLLLNTNSHTAHFQFNTFWKQIQAEEI